MDQLEQINKENENKMKFLGRNQSWQEVADQVPSENKRQASLDLSKWYDEKDKTTVLRGVKGLKSLASRHMDKKIDQWISYASG